MNFISYNNPIEFDCIDFKSNLIGINYNDYFIAYSWDGGATYRMDYDDLVGAYVDSNHNIKLVFNPEHSDDNITLLNFHEEYVVEWIAEQIYLDKEKGDE